MNKMPADELEVFLKNNNIFHYKKINLMGGSNVGKKTFLNYLEHYSNKLIDFEIKEDNEKIDEQQNNEEINSSLVEIIKKISLSFYDNTRKVDLNLYISNIDDTDFINNNIDTLLFGSECIIFMIDITSKDSFDVVSEIAESVYNQMKKNIEYGDIPIFLISNKIDREQYREVSAFEIKELIDKYEKINSYEISLNLKKNESDETINKFIVDLCNTLYEKNKNYSFYYDYLNLVKIREPMSVHNNSELFDKTDNTLNFLLLGSSKVGKSSFANKLVNNTFNENCLSTLGIDIIRTVAELYGKITKIELWDTAGQERLQSIPKKYYSKGDGFLLLFDVTDKKSFDDIKTWIKDIRTHRGGGNEINVEKKASDETMILIGNKIDMKDKRIVGKEEAESFAKKYNVKYLEISCKLGINIYEAFCDVLFDASSHNRETTNFVLNQRKNKMEEMYKHEKKSCC